MNIIEITPTANRNTVRAALRRITGETVLFVLPWETEDGWEMLLDYEILLRQVHAQGLEDIAWVIENPDQRPLAREAGFPVFASETEALTYREQHDAFPPLRANGLPAAPQPKWWAEKPRRPELPLPRPTPRWLQGIKISMLVLVLVILAGVAMVTVPSAQIVLVPSGVTYTRVVPVSVDPDVDDVDLQRGVVPTRRIGDEFEAQVEVDTTGRGYSFSGNAAGWVLFTNLLGQDYTVPAGTIVRTTAGSYPVRYETTQGITVPAFGQAEAHVQALEEGPRSNVRAFQINLVEGVAGFALRVTNPAPITGAESETVATVSDADRERAWDLAARQILAMAHEGLQVHLEKSEFLPRQYLTIQAVPKAAYTHLVGEESATLGLSLRLLVSGQAVSARDAQAVAYQKLAASVPEGYALTDARLVYGEAAEEDIGPGLFTFYVTAQGYASSRVDTEEVQEMIEGQPIKEAMAMLQEEYDLAQPPQIEVEPSWFPFIPFMAIRTEIDVVPHGW